MREVRSARQDDLSAIVRIYNHAVAHGVATFDLEPWQVEERREWLASFDETHPMLVCEDDGVVVGYAYYVPYRARPAYGATKEATVYVDPAHHRQGIGAALYEQLLAHATRSGVHVMIAVLGGHNEGSEALHRRLGFEYAGSLPEVGRKFDQWVDTTLMVRRL